MGTLSHASRAVINSIVADLSQTIWLSDVDDTLVDTAHIHTTASYAMMPTLIKSLHPDLARSVIERFVAYFDLLIAGHQVRASHDWDALPQGMFQQYHELYARVAASQESVQQQWGTVKVFSREVLLHLACEDLGTQLEPVELDSCIQQYWDAMARQAVFCSGTLRLVAVLAALGRPFYLFTGSDGRLTLHPNGRFTYDPDRSLRFKSNRLDMLRLRGLTFRRAFIGDPVDKPSHEFYDNIVEGIFADVGADIRAQPTVVLGDSFAADLRIPMSTWNRCRGLLLWRGTGSASLEYEGIASVRSWMPVANSIEAALRPRIS